MAIQPIGAYATGITQPALPATPARPTGPTGQGDNQTAATATRPPHTVVRTVSTTNPDGSVTTVTTYADGTVTTTTASAAASGNVAGTTYNANGTPAPHAATPQESRFA